MNRAPFAIAALLASCLAGAEPATLLRPTELKKEPASDAPTVAPLAEKAKVDVLERKGGWTRVKTESGAEGWVKMLVLRYTGSGPSQRKRQRRYARAGRSARRRQRRGSNHRRTGTRSRTARQRETQPRGVEEDGGLRGDQGSCGQLRR